MKISFDVVELLDFFSLQYTIAKRKYKQKLSDDDDEERKRKEKKKKKRKKGGGGGGEWRVAGYL